ncbi:MAG: DUF2993 domain-containing protein [Cyanobacteriota bacterium]
MTRSDSEPDAIPTGTASTSSGPMMQLLSGGLQRWLRSRCESVEDLEIHLQGSAFQLLRGRLEGVTVLARRVVYEGLEIEQVNLCSGAIQVQMGQLLKGQSVQLTQRFQIEGTLSFTAEALTRTLASPRWRSLGDALAEQVLGVVPLQQLKISQEALVLMAEGMPNGTAVIMETLVAAVDGTLELRSRDGQLRVPLPMDRNISIERASIKAGMLQLHGLAVVSP